MKKLISLFLVLCLVFGMAGCSGDKKNNTTAEPTKGADNKNETGDPNQGGDVKKQIVIGTWYENHYDSADKDIYASPKVTNEDLAQMQLDNVRALEKKYNVEIRFKNLTWDGLKENIDTSIMAGTPTCDVYMVDLAFGIPAVLDGKAIALDSFLKPEDYNNDIIEGITLTENGSIYLFKDRSVNCNAYMLGYNKEMLAAKNLEDPYELYKKGEWTWDKWMEMMETVNDPDNQIWGYRGCWNWMLPYLLFSNNASIANANKDANGNVTEGLSSKATMEVLDFMKQIYVDKKVSFWDQSCDDDWNANVYAGGQGKAAFFLAAHWIMEESDPDQNIDFGIVPWPTGPSVKPGDPVHHINLSTGTYYMIPKGCKDPSLTFNVLKDYFNWYNGDTQLRDSSTIEYAEKWIGGKEGSELNYEVLVDAANEPYDFGTELYSDALESKFAEGYRIHDMICGNCEVSQVVESNKNIVQDYLNEYFK